MSVFKSCYKCSERTAEPNCHMTCEKHLKEQKENEKKKEFERKKYIQEREYVNMKINNINRTIRRKPKGNA